MGPYLLGPTESCCRNTQVRTSWSSFAKTMTVPVKMTCRDVLAQVHLQTLYSCRGSNDLKRHMGGAHLDVHAS